MLNFLYMESYAITRLGIDRCSVSVLICLVLHRNTRTNQTHFMSKLDIAKRSLVSRTQAYKSLKKLCDLGLIEELANRRGEYMYLVTCIPATAADAQKSDEDAKAAALDKLVEKFDQI